MRSLMNEHTQRSGNVTSRVGERGFPAGGHPAEGAPRRALVLGGGGILGAAYEIGALAALEERWGSGAIFRDFEIFVGTSAGSFVAALLAQGIAAQELYDGFRGKTAEFGLKREDIYRIDWAKLGCGARRLLVDIVRRS